MEILVNEISNIGLTILGIVVMIIVVRWLDRNVFNKGRYNDSGNK